LTIIHTAMQNILMIANIILSILLVGLVLVQNKGTGFGRVWGSTTSFTKRGLEKMVFRFTFIITGLFILVSLLSVAI